MSDSKKQEEQLSRDFLICLAVTFTGICAGAVLLSKGLDLAGMVCFTLIPGLAGLWRAIRWRRMQGSGEHE